MTRPICIVLARPIRRSDPCFTRAGKEHALALTLRGLTETGVISRSILSVSNVVPAEIRAELRNQGFDVMISDHDEPQRRLLEVMEDIHAETAVVLTPYSLLPDAEALTEASRMVAAGQADAVFADEVIPPKFFMAINRRSAGLLAETVRRPVLPFVFPAKLAQASREEGLVIKPLTGLEPSGERFLWELLFAGKPNALPAPVFERFLIGSAPNERFDRTAFCSFIMGEYGLDDMTRLEAGLARMRRWDPSIRLAMHINYAGHLAAHFPPTRGTALKIGHGKTGMTAQLVDRPLNGPGAWTSPSIPTKELGPPVTSCPISGRTDSCRFLPLGTRPPCRKSSTAGWKRPGWKPGPSTSVSPAWCSSTSITCRSWSGSWGESCGLGGVMVHEIGTQDHEDLSHIHFEFLRHSPDEWAAMNKGTNLLSPCDFIALFEAEGFDCEVLERDVRIVRPKQLHRHWDGYDEKDLYCPRVVVKSVRRPDR